MENKCTEVNGKLIIALSRSLQWIHKDSEQLFRQNSLTLPQFAVLEALLHKGDRTVGELIKDVLSTGGNMTVVIRNLQQRGWIQRISNPDDKRSYLISLTAEGRNLANSVYQKHMLLVEEVLSALTMEEKESVILILRKLH